MASQDVRMYENKYPEVDDVVMVQVRGALLRDDDGCGLAQGHLQHPAHAI
jgi:ABC-type uncharacterized transport system auxiliary subunit